jgi:hypothetical protein
VADTSLWPKSSASSEKLLARVAFSLERGGDFPLNLKIAVSAKHPMDSSIVKLISQHSRRWKTVYLRLYPHSFESLVGAKGNFPLLGTLTLDNAPKTDSHYIDDIFEVAPRLTKVALFSWLSRIPALPWNQLSNFRSRNRKANEFPLTMLPLLPTHVQCELIIDASYIVPPKVLKPITSHISKLFITITPDSNSSHTRKIFGAILESLTFTSLTKLEFLPLGKPPRWNHSCFLAFASRSALCNTLTALNLYTIITKDEILECLLVLPMLKHLVIWDYENDGDSRAVITDNL